MNKKSKLAKDIIEELKMNIDDLKYTIDRERQKHLLTKLKMDSSKNMLIELCAQIFSLLNDKKYIDENSYLPTTEENSKRIEVELNTLKGAFYDYRKWLEGLDPQRKGE